MTTTITEVCIAEVHAQKGPATYVCKSLGSCVAIIALDAQAQVSGAAHIMMPSAAKEEAAPKGRYAHTGIPELIESMERLGADRARIRIALAGGAQPCKPTSGDSPLDLGSRNNIAVTEALRKLGLRAVAQDLGGTSGRTVEACAESGDVKIRTMTAGERTLCNLRR